LSMSAAAVLSNDAVGVTAAPPAVAEGAPVVMAMPTVTYGAPVVNEAAAAPFFGTPVVYSAPQAVYTMPGQVTYLSAPSAEAGQVMYASPATAEMGQAMYVAPLAGADVGHVTYIASAGAETSQVVTATGAAVGQAPGVAAPTVLEDGQELANDASGAAVTEGGQIVSLVPTVVEGSPVPTYVAPYVPAEPLAYAEALQGQQMYAAPMGARVNVSHEIFAKLAAGVQLTPEEMKSLSGQPVGPDQPTAVPAAHEQPVGLEGSAAAAVTIQSDSAGVTDVAGADAAADGKTETKQKDPKKKSDSKKALRASKKKKEKGCC